MALAIRVLGFGDLTTVTTSKQDLHTTSVPNGKAQIVKAMRFYNTSTSALVGINVFLTHGGTDKQISPTNLTLQPGATFIDDTEITLEQGDKLRGNLSATGTVNFVISGIERDA